MDPGMDHESIVKFLDILRYINCSHLFESTSKKEFPETNETGPARNSNITDIPGYNISKNASLYSDEFVDYDHDGAIMYVIAVLFVYSISIFLFIMSMINKTRSQEELESFLSSMGQMRQKEKCHMKHRTINVLIRSEWNSNLKKVLLMGDITTAQSKMVQGKDPGSSTLSPLSQMTSGSVQGVHCYDTPSSIKPVLINSPAIVGRPLPVDPVPPILPVVLRAPRPPPTPGRVMSLHTIDELSLVNDGHSDHFAKSCTPVSTL